MLIKSQFCRYTYKSLGDMAATIKRIRDARIPIDVAQTDIDYMDRFKDFTYSMEVRRRPPLDLRRPQLSP